MKAAHMTSLLGYTSTHEQAHFPWFRPVIFTGVWVGYAFALLTARHLTLAGVLLLTTLTLAWLVLYQILLKEQGEVHFWKTGVLGICACLTVLATVLSMGCDWLLLAITASVIVMVSPLSFSIMISLVLWLASILMVFLTSDQFGPTQFSLCVAFLFVLIFPFTLRRLLLARTQMQRLVTTLADSKAELETAHRQLQAYAAQVEELSVARERNRIARDIHDALGHYLTLLAVQLETATCMEERGDPELSHELVEARRVTKECLAEVRRSVSALRPAEITTGTVENILRRLVSECALANTDVQVLLDLEEATHTLSPLLRATLYRCAQEALTNVRKHAHATKVLLRLRTEEQQVELTVLDDGLGTASQKHDHLSGFGLQGMRERVELLGGRMQAAAGPGGRGWRVEIILPREPEMAQVSSRHAALLSTGGSGR